MKYLVGTTTNLLLCLPNFGWALPPVLPMFLGPRFNLQAKCLKKLAEYIFFSLLNIVISLQYIFIERHSRAIFFVQLNIPTSLKLGNSSSLVFSHWGLIDKFYCIHGVYWISIIDLILMILWGQILFFMVTEINVFFLIILIYFQKTSELKQFTSDSIFSVINFIICTTRWNIFF